ncbi:hypothetical protein BDZ89DRAFT_1118255 [Hymenopellis radicata]|nr:hypothetical protein BDZ89DRAFT_1118255 [Hymenopellis radicata]
MCLMPQDSLLQNIKLEARIRDLNESADHASLPILDPLGHLGDPIRLIRRPVTGRITYRSRIGLWRREYSSRVLVLTRQYLVKRGLNSHDSANAERPRCDNRRSCCSDDCQAASGVRIWALALCRTCCCLCDSSQGRQRPEHNYDYNGQLVTAGIKTTTTTTTTTTTMMMRMWRRMRDVVENAGCGGRGDEHARHDDEHARHSDEDVQRSDEDMRRGAEDVRRGADDVPLPLSSSPPPPFPFPFSLPPPLPSVLASCMAECPRAIARGCSSRMNDFGCVEYSSLLEYSTRSAISAIRSV